MTSGGLNYDIRRLIHQQQIFVAILLTELVHPEGAAFLIPSGGVRGFHKSVLIFGFAKKNGVTCIMAHREVFLQPGTSVPRLAQDETNDKVKARMHLKQKNLPIC